ncbi:hypothetical protein RRG08_064402 [Elysia crispata]|uniref:RNase H type-1 domain-containing protein n=1 Tax=Elysia crispata TaxID=231223 RepID=A0AAE1AYN2_9GAST|nr:hypothetical protein RRG08_064402 [Elysia crispata]
MVTGRRAANCFIDTYEEVSSIQVSDERKREIHKEIKEHQVQPNPPEYMNIPFNAHGSAEDATCNGGAGVYVKYPDGTDDRLSFETGLYSTNYKAETEALRAAAAHIENSPHLSHRVVFLSDALSVLQALQTGKDTDLNNLMSNLTRLCMKHTVILQWIPTQKSPVPQAKNR